MAQVEQAVILAGGRGTRLGSLTDSTPKPMLLVGGIPFLEYLVELLRRFQVHRIVFCTGYLAKQIEQHFGAGHRFGCDMRHSPEIAPAGTGGALLIARDLLENVFFVLNGDTLLEADLLNLSKVLFSRPGERLGAITLRRVADAQHYGAARIDGDQVVEFAEKARAGKGLVSGGAYCLHRGALDLLPAAPCSLEKDLLPKLARKGWLGGMLVDGFFVDIGLPETLTLARTELPRRFGRAGDTVTTRCLADSATPRPPETRRLSKQRT